VPSGLTRTREPLQIGAELYGHAGLESDIEIQKLMMQCLSISGINKIHLDLGHVAVFRGLIKNAHIPPKLETELFCVLQDKDIAGLKVLCAELSRRVNKDVLQALLLLPELYGDSKILVRAHKYLPDYPDIRLALEELEIVGNELKSAVDSIAFDLADLRGYHYHSGMVFSAYTKGCSNAIALGGRYDEIGKAFGRARPATGFSMDLRELSRLIKPDSYPKGIMAPPNNKNDKTLDIIIKQLRADGQIVIVELPDQEGNAGSSLNCDRQLVSQNGDWVVKEI
jgi:ATP phosphoribosyltransferase regulatory subunit